MLMGTYHYAIDEKGRLNFPAKFRGEMGEQFVITRWLDKCVVAFPEKEWNRMAELLTQKSVVKSRDIQRFLYSAAAQVEPDKQGRILVPPELREHAALEKDVTIIGVGAHAEIWNTAAWQAFNDELLSDGGETVEHAMEELEF